MPRHPPSDDGATIDDIHVHEGVQGGEVGGDNDG